MRRLNTLDPRRIILVVGVMLIGLALFMLPPMVTDLAAGHDDWQTFALSALITGFFGLMLTLVSDWQGTESISRRDGFVITAVTWLAVSIFGAVPFVLLDQDISLADSWFESVSGLTTTGSSVLVGLDNMPPGVLLWRSILNWLGGVGIVVMAIIMLPFLRVGGMQLFHTESSDRSDKIVPRAGQLVRYIAVCYGLLTLSCLVSYVISGMTLFDAVNHAMTTVATGGFSTHDASFAFFPNRSTIWVSTVFMFLGSLPIVIYIRMLRGGSWAFWNDVQVRGFALIVATFVVGLSIWRYLSTDLSLLAVLTEVSFNVVSIISTTGFAYGDYTAWGPPAVGAFFMLTFLGGCTGSTSGGIKIFRIQIMWLTVRGYLVGLISPHRVHKTLYDGRAIGEDVPIAVLAFVSVLFASFMLFTLALMALGIDFVTSVTGAATALTNVGPGLGPVIGPVGNFSSLPETAKVLLAFAMLLGRLEFFTLLVMLDPNLWRR
ncbi:TrkH family potassium uptake protein [Rhodoligotrophos defluvii]|uniref:TrkH family potassium uptake protein n=1 Tax=Rhodoligotrophos defluvii TaxID=2561934 RepID=UPI00196217F8|nr:TrkH family potassium uptake protein [Rhodoligotrophos defluvii]